jgi:hypothetical protein
VCICGTGVELRALNLLGRHSNTSAMPLVLFYFIFLIGSGFYALAGLLWQA